MDPKEICTKSNCVFEIKIDLTLVGNGTSLYRRDISRFADCCLNFISDKYPILSFGFCQHFVPSPYPYHLFPTLSFDSINGSALVNLCLSESYP